VKPPFHVAKLQAVITDLLKRHQATERLELTLDGQTLLVEPIKSRVMRLAYYVQTDDGYVVLERDVLFFLDAEGRWIPYKTRYLTTRTYALVDTAGEQLCLADPDNQAARAVYCDNWSVHLRDEGWLSERVTCVDPLNQRTNWPAPIVEEPDMETLQEWMNEGVCEATDGCVVETDGICSHGHPSWLLKLGWI